MESQIEILLRSDHVELDALLTDVSVALDSGGSDRVYNALDLFWARLAMHIRAEHVRLFPAIAAAVGQRAEFAEVPGLIDDLRHDHDFFMRELARSIKILRSSEKDSLTKVRDVLDRVRERLVEHDQIEEEKIYKLAAAGLVSPKTITALHRSIQMELSNLPPRFTTRTEA